MGNLMEDTDLEKVWRSRQPNLLHVIKYVMFICLIYFTNPATPLHAEALRHVTPLASDWVFKRADEADGGKVVLDTSAWQKISLPHSFTDANPAPDNQYYRGPAWYRRTITLEGIRTGERTYLEFDGVALASDIWINGERVGRHEGGYARFRFDVTPFLKVGSNVLAVRVDNSRMESIAPLGGDFTVFGGIYRPVRLVNTRAIHFDMLDYGGAGVYVTPTNVTSQSATVNWTARVANDLPEHKTVAIVVRLYDAEHNLVAMVRRDVESAGHSVTPVNLSAIVKQPHLWQGVNDPYLYQTEIEILDYDRLAMPIGLRDIRFDPNGGLKLNGKPYNVHGVNIHQSMRPGVGPAVSDAAIDEDFRILADMGVTGLRLAHYQHPQRDYELSDQKGYLLWTEVPLVSESNGSEAFAANATQQLRELIRQNINHPSVAVWGLGNEIYKSDSGSNRLLDILQKVAHDEDASRPTAYANCCGPVTQPHASHTDLLGSNVYFGWYSGEFTDLAAWGAESHGLRPRLPMSISEYGAGASILHQEDPPRRVVPASRWHPEQVQSRYHEAAWRQIRDDMPYLWASFIWVGFDFPSAGRNEGDRAGINDKGLVTFDRKVKKDAYFWYQANWSEKPMVYITSRRYTVRSAAQAEVRVYSNQASVRLSLNGLDQGQQMVKDHIAVWPVTLMADHNRIEVKSGVIMDRVDWIYQPRAPQHEVGSAMGEPISYRFAADPSPHKFGDKVYLYATNDQDNSGTYWDSTDWRLFTSKDLSHWKDEGSFLSVKVFKWARPDAKAWAPEAASRNNKYYFYAPVGGDKIGVAISDAPEGPFIDARGDALIDKARDANAGDEPIDPAVLIDDDGQAYLLFGTRVPKIVRLKPDMMHTDGPIKDLIVTGFPVDDPKKTYGEAPFLHEHDGLYYFSFSTGWPGQIVYATSTSPMGPYTFGGVVLDYLKISTNHQAILEIGGNSYLFYHDNLLPGGGDYRRAIAIKGLTYGVDGSLHEVVRKKDDIALGVK